MKLLIVFLCLAFPAQAQEQKCKPHDLMLNYLLSNYQERVVFRGFVTERGGADEKVVAMNETTASNTGTWTTISTDLKTGIACMVAGGNDGKIVGLAI